MSIILKQTVEHDLGEIVYLKTDTDQRPRIVTGYLIQEGKTRYELASGTIVSYHYAIEITGHKSYSLN